jgi:selenide,water dikinase
VRGVADEAHADLLVGLAPFDDAAVLRLSDDLALVSTTDFFPPLVDDPADFGAIAAANACSDVFAMGGRVTIALNVCAFPERLPAAVISSILSAAAEVVAAAGGVIAGGHTIRSEEPIFGLAVQGLVHPDRVLTKRGAQPGDVLVISKPLGTGIVLAGGSPEDKAAAISGMKTLNNVASQVLSDHGTAAHAVTDVTGFGLVGHSWEMADRSGVRIRLESAAMPLYPGARRAASDGTRTGGDARNREYLGDRVRIAAPDDLAALAFDPQTSGGLLASVDPEVVGDLIGAGFWRVGEVAAGEPGVDVG